MVKRVIPGKKALLCFLVYGFMMSEGVLAQVDVQVIASPVNFTEKMYPQTTAEIDIHFINKKTDSFYWYYSMALETYFNDELIDYKGFSMPERTVLALNDTFTYRVQVKLNLRKSYPNAQLCFIGGAYSRSAKGIGEELNGKFHDNKSCLNINYINNLSTTRNIDIKIAIPDSIDNDTIFSPNSQSVATYMINMGPDSLHPGDRLELSYFSGYVLNGMYFPFVGYGVGVGDTFVHHAVLSHDWKNTVYNSEHCVRGKVIALVEDSLVSEDYLQDNDNRACVSHNYVTKVSSISSHQFIKTLEVYPNPTSDYLNIIIDPNFFIGVYSILGEKMSVNYTPWNEGLQLNVKSLATGVYLLRTSKGTIKFIKK